MRHRLICGSLAIVLAAVLAAPAQAQLATYSQDFEGLVQADPGALAGDGWLVFGNVFDSSGTVYFYGYGPFPAPNGGPGFSGIDLGQGGPAQGAQQMVVYNDYNNGDHGNGFRIEANVFQEQTVGAGDVGNTWVFQFDAKAGNIEDDLGGVTTALAFIKTLDPNNSFATTNFITVDTTNIPTTWDTYSVGITIDASLVGQILQTGFASTTTLFTPSGIFYDNITFADSDPDDDGVTSDVDNCPNDANPAQSDGDGDGVGDVCDNCPDDPNADQADGNLNGVGNVCDPEPIPTVSEWGLILMGLLLLTTGTVVLSRRSSVFATSGGATFDSSSDAPMFVPGLFARVLAATLGLVAVGFSLSVALAGSLSGVDIAGSLICAPVLAYLVHLWIAPKD